MKTLSYRRAKWSAAFFFFIPGLVYGLFSSRMPFLKAQAEMSASEVGLALLALGAAALVGLTLADRILSRLTVKAVIVTVTAAYMVFLCLSALSQTAVTLAVFFGLMGFFIGICDVTMNVLGIEIERRFSKPTIGVLHAGYSLGGFAGSLLGSLFAAAGIGAVLNFLVPMIVSALLLLLCSTGIVHIAPQARNRQKASLFAAMPGALLLCGVLAFMGYVSEGICGDWGSLYLMHMKAAPEAAAALVYGVVAACALASRLATDTIRTKIGSFAMLLVSSLVALAGILAVLVSPSWHIALAGFVLTGFGLGPVIPLLFSFAGKIPGITASKASSVVSLFGYGGLLFCPPIFGFLAEHFSMTDVFIAAALFLVILAAGSLAFRGKN